uniref:RNA polymerase II nuclear localization protein SLC7A6OS n=1 Tax=Mesocestoides corti TaxID=53468 RepID=A0A5K3EVJ0_MESCO
ADLTCRSLKRIQPENWLSSKIQNVCVIHPSLCRIPGPSMKTETTEQALLTNTGAVNPSPSRWLHRPVFAIPHSRLSLVGCISSSHAIGSQRERKRAAARAVQYVCALVRRRCRIPEP